MERVFKYTGTESTLEVDLNSDSGKFIFKGESRPENAVTYFEPILKWLKEYYELSKTSSVNVLVDFDLEYFNSTSYKYILDIFKILKEISLIENMTLEIIWKYDAMDLDILESGNDFAKWADIDVKFVAK